MEIKTFEQGVAFWRDKKRMTVMLLVPFYSFHPLYETRRAGCPIGIELIASELVARGFNVVFIDACMSEYRQLSAQADGSIRYGLTDIQLESVLAGFNPAIVGITNLFSNQAANVDHLVGLVRKVYPQTLIVEGGAQATGDVNEVLKNYAVDMVVREEGLITFPELCQSVELGVSTRCHTTVPGISYKNSSGSVQHNARRDFIPNLDLLAMRRLEIPLHPMYDTLDHAGGSRHCSSGRHAYLLSSVGCPNNCDFCFIRTMAGNVRGYSLRRFEQDVARLKNAGVNEVVLEDDMLFADVSRALSVADILKRHGMSWFEEGGISAFKLVAPGGDLSSQTILENLAESGCYRYYLAIESANANSLDYCHKPSLNCEQDLMEKIVRNSANLKMETVGGFMVGFKGDGFEETLGDMERTVAYATRLKAAGLAYVMFFIFTAIPGTRTYNYLKSVFPGLDLRTSHERAAFPVGGLTPKQLTAFRKVWMLQVNGKDCTDKAAQTGNWGI